MDTQIDDEARHWFTLALLIMKHNYNLKQQQIIRLHKAAMDNNGIPGYIYTKNSTDEVIKSQLTRMDRCE